MNALMTKQQQAEARSFESSYILASILLKRIHYISVNFTVNNG